ncbi:hypothetical protein MKL29_06865 [Streptococcus suis]|nr:hypothetical protein [Streptococcus suis]
MISKRYLDLYLKKTHFTTLEHLLFRIVFNGEFPDDMYFSLRVRNVIINLVNRLRKSVKGYESVGELYRLINEAIDKELGGEDNQQTE